jgi:TRAP transporter TAXI family solute receptor
VGKTIIGKRPALPEVEQITNALLKVYNIAPGQVRIVSTTNTGEAVNALKSDTVDAVMIPASKGASYLQSLAHDGKIKFLDIPAEKIEAMRKLLPPSLSVAVFPAKIYQGQDKTLNVFSLSTYLVAASRVPEETVYKVTKAFFDQIGEFHGFHAEAKEWTLQETLTDAKIPYHPGAIRYFKEKGAWSAELEKTQNQLKRN